MKRSNILFIFILSLGLATFLIPIGFYRQLDINEIPGIALIFIAIAYLFLFILGMYFKFEESHVSSKEIALIAIYSAFAAVSRIPFVGIPSVQPVSYLVLCAGYVFGPLIGFIIGGNTAFISNIFLGQGVWTIYQVFAWGFFGLIGGILGKNRSKEPDKWILALIGFLLAFLYGWFMNVWAWLLIRPITLASIIATNVQSIPFDIAHALTNFILLLIFGESTIRILLRYQQRFEFTIKPSQEITDISRKKKIS